MTGTDYILTKKKQNGWLKRICFNTAVFQCEFQNNLAHEI